MIMITAVEFIIEEVEFRGLTTKELRASFNEARKMSKKDMISFLKSVFQQDGFDYEKAYQDWIDKRMKIEDNCVEYRTQQHEMLVEGTSDFKPTENAIMEHGNEKGFLVTNIEIWLDSIQKFWRWNGNIANI